MNLIGLQYLPLSRIWKWRDIFKLKVKLLQAITELSIKYRVSFTSVKTYKSYTQQFMLPLKSRAILVEMCARRDYMPLFPRVQVDTSRLNFMYEIIYVAIYHFDLITVSDHIFVCNVIWLIVRNKIDFTPGCIIDYI